MPGLSYSSKQFGQDWRYAVDKEFVDPNGQPFEYAENGKQAWGDELKCLKFDSPPKTAAISHNGKYLAIAVDQDIHILDTKTNDLRLLKGHTSRVDTLAFKPGDDDMLVSFAMYDMASSVAREPTILLWQLGMYIGKADLTADEISTISKRAVRAVVEGLTDLETSLHLPVAEQNSLAAAFKPSILQALTRENVSNNVKICGRLPSSFQSNVFSPSGKYMMYLPGSSPQSNGDERWDIKIYSMDTRKDILTLTGHRDAIMWIGYSPDETLIGTVAWDMSMRIWNASTGTVKYTFETAGQNWTGGFSANGKMFAGTCGDGSVHVYSLADGKELFRWDVNSGWCRALDWSPDSTILAVGARNNGKMVLIDVQKQQMVQERLLSTARAKVENEELRRFLGHSLEVYRLKFVDDGRKIVCFTAGDGSAEMYDLAKHCKWRFARAGTDSYYREIVNFVETESTHLIKGGYEMVSWEDGENGLVMLATVDGDAVRLWSVQN